MSWLSVVWALTDRGDAGVELARQEAARATGVRLAALSVVRLCPACGADNHGRPSFVSTAGADLPSLSVSRGGGVIVVALSSGATVGVDVEAVEAFVDAGVAGVLLHEGESASGPDSLAVSWVRKEAALKAAGVGLAVEPSRVRLSPAGEPSVVLDWPTELGWSRPDWILDLDLGVGLRAAVAGSGPAPCQVSVRQVDAGALLG